ncbi:hypothetical protein V3C99_015856 [Haemonchus contortus]|uniref:Protein sleepless n=1 Tax=Haemonchus contortus TaxID=6289 RepID=A0A7I4YWP6_HAECO
MFVLLFLYTSSISVSTEKCYSCSSPQLQMRWPKDEETNKLQFLREFPWYANESCDQVRNLLPVVDCPDSVCIKAVITEPPAKRDVCVQGGAVVRDCWSRVIGEDGPFALDPRALRDVVKLSEDGDGERILGLIYTCRGFLCNISPSTFHFAQLIVLPLLSILIGYLTL